MKEFESGMMMVVVKAEYAKSLASKDAITMLEKG